MSIRLFITGVCRCLLLALICLVALVVAAQTAEEARRQYDLPAGDAATTLRQFSALSGREILYAAEVIRGVRTSAVKGEYTAVEALEHMLVGTNLYAIPEEAIALRQKAVVGPAASPVVPSNPSEPPPMKHRTILSVLAGWLIAGSTASAQSDTGAIEGRVLNALNGTYLVNARVTVDGTKLQAFSNEYGEYHIAGVPPGTPTLHVFYTGLATQSATVELPAGKTVVRNISLTTSDFTPAKDGEPARLDPFMVASSKETNASAIAINEQRFAPNIKNVVSADEFGTLTEGNVGEFLKFLPGVTINYTGADARSVAVRGMADTDTAVMIDGNMAPPSVAGPATRTFAFDQLSINNIARVEVTKVPTPDSNADSIGGTINLISRSAFERSRPEFNYRAYLSMNQQSQQDVQYLSLGRSPGPGREPRSKIRPGFDFSYIKPVSKSFGFTLSGSNSNVFNSENGSNVRWNPTSNSTNIGTLANPVMSAYVPGWGPKTTSRYSLASTADWRMGQRHVFRIGGSWNAFDAMINETTATFNATGSGAAATNPAAWGPTFTQGANNGSISWAPLHRRSYRSTYVLNSRYQYNGPEWKFEASGYTSHSHGKDADADEGYFAQFTYDMTPLSLRFDGINPNRPDTISATTSGVAAGIRALAGYTLRTATVAPGNFNTTAKGAKANVSRFVRVAGESIQVKVGVDARRVIADSRKLTETWTFVGADGRAATADDRAGNYDLVDTSLSSVPAPYGNGSWQYLDTYKAYQLYRDHPQYFLHNDATQISNAVLNSQVVTEDISASYLRFDGRFLDNRLWVVAGARYEHTHDDGYGPVDDLSRTYQRDAKGDLILVGGKPVKIVADAITLNRLRYVDRGAHIGRNYGDFYPSINVTYNITANLIARGGYAETLSRPDYTNIVPGTTLPDPAGTSRTIVVNNTELKPWTARNYDIALSYYPTNGGEASVGLFRKDIKDFFGGTTVDVTPELAERYGLDNSYANSGYVLSYLQNVGRARITGVEFNYRQPLKFLPTWARGVNVRYNITQLHLQGNALADFSAFMPRSQNLGVSLDRPTFGVRFNWNFRGTVRRGAIGGAAEPGTYEYLPPRPTIDIDAEYRFARHLGLFVGARNITAEPWRAERYGPNTPAYARAYRRLDYGTAISVGLKGSF